MKNDSFQKRAMQIAQDSARQQDSVDAVRTVFEQMTAEAKRQSEIERKDARHRSPLVKLLLALTLASVLSAAAIGVYGIYNFPDAPLRQNGDVYTGKRGQPRSREDFERFNLWKNALFGSFGSTFLLGFAFAALDTREKRRRDKLNHSVK